jgi:hypothetical protein
MILQLGLFPIRHLLTTRRPDSTLMTRGKFLRLPPFMPMMPDNFEGRAAGRTADTLTGKILVIISKTAAMPLKVSKIHVNLVKHTTALAGHGPRIANSRQAQPNSLKAIPECHIFVMWLILSPVNCIT